MKNTMLLALLCLCVHPLWAGISRDSAGYRIDDSVLIRTRDGALISALVVRHTDSVQPLPVILQFTIYARTSDINKAILAVKKGYVGVFAYTRGKRYSPDTAVPYEKDGSDAYDVIDWISRQPWCNGSVGMYGGSYNGFTQWAATKKLHPALKTIVPSASVAPGLDVPMTNHVFMSFLFPWIYYVTNNKFLDNSDYTNNQQWENLYQRWFESGRSYRALDTMMGRPGNSIFQRWLDHPTYDSYWQAMIPYKQEFATINIPVLTTTGYYDGGQITALYYLREHTRYNSKAEHYLLIGPYGHFGSQGSPDSVYNGYRIDEVANISITAIIYEWFDHILKGRKKPAQLKDKINYEVMDANEWKHAASLQAVSNDTLRFYLSPKSRYPLSRTKSRHSDFMTQEINFADRTTKHSYYWLRNSIYDTLLTNGLLLTSAPLPEAVDITGFFFGALTSSINKKDMDCSVVLFEQKPDGRYFYLSYFMGRASYAKNPDKRQLLVPGKKETMPFSNTYFTAKRLEKGSRIVAILNINKSPYEQINYGTGKDVSEETIQDAGEPLRIKWYTDSYISIPVWRANKAVRTIK